jgi:hypothetical protein
MGSRKDILMLADKEHLEKWVETGKKEKRADAPDIEIMLNVFSESLLHDNVLRRQRINLGHKEINGVVFNLYQPWYKSCPIGMIHDIGILLDGERVSREAIQLILKGGQRIMLFNARTIQDIWWNIIDPIGVFVMTEKELGAGDHDLEVMLAEEVSAYYEFPLNMLMGHKKIRMHLAA